MAELSVLPLRESMAAPRHTVSGHWTSGRA